jgi:hypothetical protein
MRAKTLSILPTDSPHTAIAVPVESRAIWGLLAVLVGLLLISDAGLKLIAFTVTYEHKRMRYM